MCLSSEVVRIGTHHAFVDCPQHGATAPAHRTRTITDVSRLGITTKRTEKSLIRGARYPNVPGSRADEAYCAACYAQAHALIDAATAQWRTAQDLYPNPNAYPPLQAAFNAFRATLVPLTLRLIKMREPTATSRNRCGSACTNGKTSCDCPCLGRCHGAGKCYCPGA